MRRTIPPRWYCKFGTAYALFLMTVSLLHWFRAVGLGSYSMIKTIGLLHESEKVREVERENETGANLRISS